MDRFHNKYGTLTKEAQDIINELWIDIRDTVHKYRDDIEALIFLREAIGFLISEISGEILMYSHNLYKKEHPIKKE